MQQAEGGGTSAQSGDLNDSHHAIVSDIVSLIERVQTSMKRVESAIAREASLGDPEIAGNVFILDDVTPRYVKANAALDTCNAGLGVALHFLLDVRTPKHGADQPAERGRGPARRIGHA
jgi:hypothetical protein